MTIQSAQFRAARAHLNMSLQDVVDATGINRTSISDIEQGKTSNPRASTIETLRLLYESKGVEFMDNGGIAPRHVRVEQYQGAEGFKAFMNDVYEVAKTEGGQIRLHNAKPANWLKWLGDEWNAMHTQRMQNIEKEIDFRITAGHGDNQFIGKHAEYRWLPKDMWNEQSFYSYGDRYALLSFDEDNVHIVVIYNRDMAQSFRALFDYSWQNVATKPEDSSEQ